MLKLYYTPGACSQAPHIALRELNLPFEAIRVDLATHTLQDGRDFRPINPKGYVPLIELEDGTRLTETNVILQYIADQRPGTLAPVFGIPERWKLMEWLAYIASEVHKTFGPLFFPDTPPKTRERSVQYLGDRFMLISQSLEKRPYLNGNAPTIADIYLFVLLNWTDMLKVDLSPWPTLRTFQSRVGSRPAVHATLRAEGLI